MYTQYAIFSIVICRYSNDDIHFAEYILYLTCLIICFCKHIFYENNYAKNSTKQNNTCLKYINSLCMTIIHIYVNCCLQLSWKNCDTRNNTEIDKNQVQYVLRISRGFKKKLF